MCRRNSSHISDVITAGRVRARENFPLNCPCSARRSENQKARLIGITGQDGSYLAEFLLAKAYVLHGVIQCASNLTPSIGYLCHNTHIKQAILTPLKWPWL